MNPGILSEPSPLPFPAQDGPVYHSRRGINRFQSSLGTIYGTLAIPTASLLSVTMSGVW